MSILNPLARLILAVTALAAFGTVAAAQGSKSQVVMLPDPTPRQPDLEQKYSKPAVSGTAADHAAMVLNEQRQALIVRASNQLASLAAVLNDGIQKHEKGTSLAAEVQIAELMEKLAKNVNTSIKLAGDPATTGRTPKSDSAKTNTASVAGDTLEAQLKQQAGQLVVIVQELQAEVGKTNRDTLSVGALAKSAEVERAAKSLKERMKKRSSG
jgi:acetylornithine deacetylase/succinyl-diaminopimelate desuccinylase-like protein